MSSKGKGIAEKSFDELFNSIDEPDLLAIEARILMFRFLGEVDKICKERGISRKTFAIRTGTSASYITQLFQGKKFINFLMLAKIQKVLHITFNIKVADNNNQSEQKAEAKPTTFAYPVLDKFASRQAGLFLTKTEPGFHKTGSLPLKAKIQKRPEKSL